jgi:hypothetical protein
MKKLTTEEFIKKAQQIHGDKYDYSKVNYLNSHIKACIICLEHGEFWQLPNCHLNYKGCPMCGREHKNEWRKLTTEKFIQKAKQVHGDKYDYSQVQYINSAQKICIKCPEHGEFFQLSNNHFKNGCPKCGGSKALNKEEFIERAIRIHGKIYDYSKSEYKNNKTKICIICPKHGEFWQKPIIHLYEKSGCTKCRRSKGEETIEQWLINHNIQFETQKKFKDCKNKLPLPFDFYLLNYNICIEYDGIQHFKSKKFYGGIDALFIRQKNDKIKDQYCIDNNIDLLRIPYTEFKNINNILNSYFNIKEVF